MSIVVLGSLAACAYVAIGVIVARYIMVPWVKRETPLTWADGEGRGIVGMGAMLWPAVLICAAVTAIGHIAARSDQ